VPGAGNDPIRPAHVDSVSTGEGPAVGVNHGVINYLVGQFRELRRQVISLQGLPMELGLQDPACTWGHPAAPRRLPAGPGLVHR